MNKKKPFSEIPTLKSDRITLKPLTLNDTQSLKKLTENERVYRFLPTFLFEKKYPDPTDVIDRLYTEAMEESLILGIFENDVFCGLAEMYGFKDNIHKISVGYRLKEEAWGRGIASETLRLMVDYLYNETDIEIITASTMVENLASARVLMKNGFTLVVSSALEDWGYEEPTVADKWIR